MASNRELDEFYEKIFAEGNYPSAFHGIYFRETGSSPDKATAGKGTRHYGPMQLGELAAREVGVDRFNPFENIKGGLELARKLLDKFGSTDKALAAYNWGSTNLSKHLAKHGDEWFTYLPPRVQEYVLNVGARDPLFLEASRREQHEQAAKPSIYDIQQMFGSNGSYVPVDIFSRN